jgi:hypothetical protein
VLAPGGDRSADEPINDERSRIAGEIERAIPLDRMAKPEEIATVVLGYREMRRIRWFYWPRVVKINHRRVNR